MSEYSFYINKIRLPITPSSLTIQSPGRNEVIDLIDGSQINVLKEPGLKEVQFEFVLPQTELPFAHYQNGSRFLPPNYFLEKFEKLRNEKTACQFIVVREVFRTTVTGRVNVSFKTNLKMAIEDLQQVEDAEADGLDLRYSITLKEAPEYGTKEFIIEKQPVVTDPDEPTLITIIPNKGGPTVVRQVDQKRSTDPDIIIVAPARRTYSVKSGDSLWAICARELGDGSKCRAVATKNGITDPDAIYPGQVLDLTGV